MIDGRFRFDNFVVGPANRLALSAARSVAESPGKSYNPLFICAAPGLGKTHLLTALGVAAREIDPSVSVEYRAADAYVEQWRAAAEAGDTAEFRREIGAARLLLLDDIQFLAERTETHADLLRLVDKLQQDGRQVVMASDRPPADLGGLDQRLLSRLTGGLIVEIGPPDPETRLGILRALRQDRAVDIPDGALDELARAPSSNVRELQGLFNRLVAHQALATEAMTEDAARVLVAQARGERAAPPDEFETFVSELAEVVSSSVEQWRVRLAATVARWSGEGFRTGELERHLEDSEVPDLDALESRFASLVNRLRDLEREAARLDPRLAGVSAFRDPARVDEAEAIVLRALAAYDPPPAAAAHFTIDNLDAGARNQLALRAAGEVIALPGSRYNPLYVHGPPGAGKTHLAHAIANALSSRDGTSWTVACVETTALADDLQEAISSGVLDRWRLRFRAVDALVLENVQRLAGRERAQDEVFHLFDALRETGRQVILTADVPPPQLGGVAERLRSRFESGLVVEMGRVSEAEAVARHTPVPDGAEAAAPTIDAWFEEAAGEARAPTPYITSTTAPVDSFFLDPEKVITEWPSLDGLLVEDPR
jgi:chromosomal replication initiation ATPase DnaA